MNKKFNIVIVSLLVLALGLGIFNFVRPKTQTIKEIIQQIGAVPGTGFDQPVNLGAGFKSGGVFSTSTLGTVVPLLLNNIDKYSVIDVTPNANDVSLTFPASTTLVSLMPNVGDTRTWYIRNATTTATYDITIAVNTGILLKNASSSPGVAPVIYSDTDGGNFGRVTLIRKPNKDYEMLCEVFKD